jgi:hypothetical protein
MHRTSASNTRTAILCSLLSLPFLLGGLSAAEAAPKGDTTTAPGRGKKPREITNTPPRIAGTPQTSVVQDTPYRFSPIATDADGDSLTFTITNRPSWASFDNATGALSGIPRGADVATYTNVVISVSDGRATSQLPPFSIAVQAYAFGSATLSWQAPIENSDGSPLLDLAGYRIYWGKQSGNYTNSINNPNPGVTTYVIENLTSGMYYFVATAVSGNGVESARSEEVFKLIP